MRTKKCVVCGCSAIKKRLRIQGKEECGLQEVCAECYKIHYVSRFDCATPDCIFTCELESSVRNHHRRTGHRTFWDWDVPGGKKITFPKKKSLLEVLK
jgi:hypothetical protein